MALVLIVSKDYRSDGKGEYPNLAGKVRFRLCVMVRLAFAFVAAQVLIPRWVMSGVIDWRAGKN